MSHVVPMLGYHRDGLFCYDMTFFEELSYVNGYDILKTWLYLPEGLIPLQEDIYEHIQFPPDRCGEPLWMCVLLRKCFDKPYQTPFQGFYKADRDDIIARRYFIVRDNTLFPDTIETWVSRAERVRALAERAKNVIKPPEIFTDENFDKAAVLRYGFWASRGVTKRGR